MKRIFHAFTSAARELFRRWAVLLILIVLYLAMLGAIYWFFVTREATIGQLILSLLLALAAPILFLIIQTMAARYNQGGQRTLASLAGSSRDFWKLLVISLPLIIIAVLAIYLFGNTGKASPANAVTAAAPPAASAPPRPVTSKPEPVNWATVTFTAIEYLLFCLILPLAAIHLWIATARDGLTQAFRRSPRILARAFAPRSVVIYAIGFVFFAVIPYFLIVTKTPVSSTWLDAGLLIGRLLLAALFSLIGWVVTVGALGEQAEAGGAIAQSNEGAGHVPVEA